MTESEAIMLAVKSGEELALTERAMDGLRIQWTNLLIATDISEHDVRERLYVALKTVDLVREALRAAMIKGANAKAIEQAAAALVAH